MVGLRGGFAKWVYEVGSRSEGSVPPSSAPSFRHPEVIQLPRTGFVEDFGSENE